eukprot:4167339-Pleurochrysis_carterae.AAC.1
MQECDSCFARSCRARDCGNLSRCQRGQRRGLFRDVCRNYKKGKTTLALAAHNPPARSISPREWGRQGQKQRLVRSRPSTKASTRKRATHRVAVTLRVVRGEGTAHSTGVKSEKEREEGQRTSVAQSAKSPWA